MLRVADVAPAPGIYPRALRAPSPVSSAFLGISSVYQRRNNFFRRWYAFAAGGQADYAHGECPLRHPLAISTQATARCSRRLACRRRPTRCPSVVDRAVAAEPISLPEITDCKKDKNIFSEAGTLPRE